MDEKELITIGINYLSDNIYFRDIIDLPNKNYSYAVQYSNYQMRIIRRVLDFIYNSEDHLKWLHDFLLKTKLEQDIFEIFFKIWSHEYKRHHLIKYLTN